MTDILYNIEEKTDWKQLDILLEQLEPHEKERVFGFVEGALFLKQFKQQQQNENA
ncbi:hypothetical protein [Lysinibacillus sp. NPDC047702]|uniref:hypothetical protein n=1 Tax=unclassified Lysinibacillus TaxID=2636778 RepID=UPI003D06A018